MIENDMALSSFTIRNFKSYDEATLHLAPLTILAGANASGKSNAIEALRLLSWVASGHRLSVLSAASRDSLLSRRHSRIRGDVGDLTGRDGPLQLACDTEGVDWNRYSVSLQAKDGKELHIVDERLTGTKSTVPLFEVKAGPEGMGGDLSVAYNNFARGGRKPQVACNDQMAVLIQLQSAAQLWKSKNGRRTIPKWTRAYENLLRKITFLDPNPSLMREYSYQADDKLSAHGENLSGVLHNLCRRDDTKRELLDFVKDLPEQDISNVQFVETPRNEAMVKLTETFGGAEAERDATLLSDGTLRVLSIAAAVLSGPEGSMTVVEEADNGIHPSRAKRLLERVSRIARRRRLRILLSTHNPALLDALPNNAVPNVVFCYRDPESGCSKLVRLQDIPDYPELVAQGTVGQLMASAILDRFVKERPPPDERRRQSLDWIASLRNDDD